MYMGQVGGTVQYERKIRYLDYMENGERSQGAGFIKLERRDELCNISLQVNGIYRRDRFTRPLLLVGEKEERELCKLQLADGGIKTCFEGLDSRNLGGQGMGYDDLYGIRIPISDGKEIRCIWRRREESEETQEAATQGTEVQEAGMQGTAMPDARVQDSTSHDAELYNAVTHDTGMWDAVTRDTKEWNTGAQNTGVGNKKTQSINRTTYKEDKWDQLCMIYPHVRPFSDEREYLSIGPSDFVIFGSHSYKLVGNSFLLHGYYNFRHLILMRGGRRDQRRYYVGVPGNLYERDKKTALMFGFEGFECAKEPAEEGDFGYFLIPVEL